MASDKQKKVGHTGNQLTPFLLGVIAVASVLVFVHFQMSVTFAERKHVQRCHSESLAATENLPEEVDMAEYYEFLFKTCVRDKGYTI